MLQMDRSIFAGYLVGHSAYLYTEHLGRLQMSDANKLRSCARLEGCFYDVFHNQ